MQGTKVNNKQTNELATAPILVFNNTMQETGVTLIRFGILGFQEFFTGMLKPPKNEIQPNLTFIVKN